jgi:hypothetical protein
MRKATFAREQCTYRPVPVLQLEFLVIFIGAQRLLTGGPYSAVTFGNRDKSRGKVHAPNNM